MKRCIFRSTNFELIGCNSCRGSVKVKQFGCQIHMLCTEAKQLYQMVPGYYWVCNQCPNRWEEEDAA